MEQAEIDEFANEKNLKFIQASAQNNSNVEQVVIMMVQNLLDRVFPSLLNAEMETETPRTVKLDLELKGDQTADDLKPLEDNSSSICCPT